MAFKDLLVVVDDSAGAVERIGVAARLASTFGAHLTGLHVAESPAVRPSVLAQFPIEVLDMLATVSRADAATARAIFEREVRAVDGGIATEWRSVEGDSGEVISLH